MGTTPHTHSRQLGQGVRSQNHVTQGPLYTRVSPSIAPLHVQLRPQSNSMLSIYCRPDIVRCRVISFEFYLPVSLGGECSEKNGPFYEIFNNKKNYFQWMTPIWPMLRVRAKGKARPDFFKPTQSLGAQIVPPKTPHGISDHECSCPTPI